MVTRAVAKGSSTSAITVQASQVFSQAHLRAYFIGIVKLAFVTPARIRIAIPNDVLFTSGFLPLSFSRYRCEICLADSRQINGSNTRVASKGLTANIGGVRISTGFYHIT